LLCVIPKGIKRHVGHVGVRAAVTIVTVVVAIVMFFLNNTSTKMTLNVVVYLQISRLFDIFFRLKVVRVINQESGVKGEVWKNRDSTK
jgi:hypothetical protein